MSETIRNKRKLLGALEEAIQYINSAIDGVNSNDKDCMEEYVAGAVGVLKGGDFWFLLQNVIKHFMYAFTTNVSMH